MDSNNLRMAKVKIDFGGYFVEKTVPLAALRLYEGYDVLWYCGRHGSGYGIWPVEEVLDYIG